MPAFKCADCRDTGVSRYRVTEDTTTGTSAGEDCHCVVPDGTTCVMCDAPTDYQGACRNRWCGEYGR